MPIEDSITTEYEESYNYYLSFAKHLVKTDPEDLVQDSFLLAFKSRNQFKGSSVGELRVWLKTIVRNQAYDLFRKFIRRPEWYADSIESEHINIQIPSPESNVEQSLLSIESKKKLHRQIAKLSKAERNTIQIFLTFGTVGDSNTLKVTKMRAINHLRRLNCR